MKCRPVQNMLSAYQDGELDAHRAAAVKRHLERCPACRRHYARLQQARDMLAGLEPIRPSAGFFQQVRARIEQAESRREIPAVMYGLRRFIAPAAVGALLVVGIAAGAFLGNVLIPGRSAAPLEPARSGYRLEVTLASFQAFDPVPPQSLADRYLRSMRGFSEAPR